MIKNRWLAVVIAGGAVLVAPAQAQAQLAQSAGDGCVGPFSWWETAADLELSASNLAEMPESVPVPHVQGWSYASPVSDTFVDSVGAPTHFDVIYPAFCEEGTV